MQIRKKKFYIQESNISICKNGNNIKQEWLYGYILKIGQ